MRSIINMPHSFEQSQDEIARLVKHFAANRATYVAPAYKEAHARQEFIDPLFVALNWDVPNRQQAAPDYREVIIEDSLDIEGQKKAPDYAFRVGRERKFFAEAKKPGVNIKADPVPAYQLRRYAWSAKLPLSLLTDFEELAVYDCRIRPAEKDKPGVARVNYVTCEEYADRWREVWDVFSREAIWGGSFDQFTQTSKGKRGTSEVDAEFLKEIEGWREGLAKNIALRNPRLTIDELNDAVQRLIDRIIFLRMAEARGIEEYGRLQRLALTPPPSPAGRGAGGEGIYAELLALSRQADAKYNSGLFDFSKTGDQVTPRLVVDDKALKPILADLYYPQSPYEFSVLPAEILGNVYEQFLGKVIRLTAAHQAKVEEKPEVKKAGGVYYTPAYIVEYIVQHTVGQQIEGKSPKQLKGFRVLDMACGSGSFLLGAYQYLLDYYQKWYAEHDPHKHAGAIRPQGETWRLTTAEKKRLLVEHLFGVDIDRQAVEVTKLSLLLKVLEGESDETVGKQLRLLQERALPNLDRNIKCGNSLIGPDYFSGQLLPDADELRRVNPFDWAAEFPEVFAGQKFALIPGPSPAGGRESQAGEFPSPSGRGVRGEGEFAGGFDCVIGNPPYIRSQSLGAEQREYYSQRYQSATGTYDIYVLFVEAALKLIHAHARAGFILPNKFFTTDYGNGLRRVLGRNKLVERIVDFEDAQIFLGAGTYTNLLFLSKEGQQPEYARLGEVYRREGRVGLAKVLASSEILFAPIKLTDDGARWTMAAGHSGGILLRLQETYPSFSNLKPHIFQGLKTSADKVFLVRVEKRKKNVCEVITDLDQKVTIESAILKPIVKGERVQRYSIDESEESFILYPYHVDAEGKATLMSPKELEQNFPQAWEYLNQHSKTLGARDGGKWGKRSDWYCYARSQNIGTFLGKKILVPYMTTRLRVAPDVNGNLFFVNITTGGYGLRLNGEYEEYFVSGLLNSKLFDYCIRQMTNQFRGGYFAVNKQALERLPFRPINFTDSTDKARHDKMVTLVEQMLDLHQRKAQAKDAAGQERLQRLIDSTDKQIDALVYELYGLTPEEIAVVENAGKQGT